MAKILSQIEHVVAVMFENRSFDNLCGWLYPASAQPPAHFLPQDSPAKFNGLDPAFWNPRNSSYFSGAQPEKVPIARQAGSFTTPQVDPKETYEHVTRQLYGPDGYSASPRFLMKGFLVDYEQATTSDALEIMQPFSSAQVPVLSALARNYAVSDAWFSSVPSQTWPNRAFVHAGTSNGNVDNGTLPDPFDWNVPTIFNVLDEIKTPWRVFSDADIAPTLTRTMFPRLWDPLLNGRFQHFSHFEERCQNGDLDAYSFIEPSFLIDPNDEHPPHDVRAGEQFLRRIWHAVSQSPKWQKILLIITFDEHGGTYDHVLPPTAAAIPDQASDSGRDGFRFDRFGVRVPTILVSPWIEPGTIFRSNTAVPLDHTSILATLRDWLEIPAARMLPSRRIAQAPTLEYVLTRKEPRPDVPTLNASATITPTPPDLPVNDLQKSLVSGTAKRFGMDPEAVFAKVKTRQHAADFFRVRGLKPDAS